MERNFGCIEALTSDSLVRARLVSRFAARVNLPREAGNWFLRLIHLPSRGAEIVWDFTKTSERSGVCVTRFLEPLRPRLGSMNFADEKPEGVSREISVGELSGREPVIQEIDKGIAWGCRQGLESNVFGNHYFILYVNAEGDMRTASITNPYSQPHTESWQRLINRAIGSGLIPPRRFVVDCATSK